MKLNSTSSSYKTLKYPKFFCWSDAVTKCIGPYYIYVSHATVQVDMSIPDIVTSLYLYYHF